MHDLYDYYVEYIKQYIKILTEGKDEFFLSLCDIEEEFLQRLEESISSTYRIVVINNKDYSPAVRLRNDIEQKQIVLLSSEGIKQIDSLKDFNEYSVLSRNRDHIWKCLEQVFNIKLKTDEKTFLETILSQGEISFGDFLNYLYESGITDGQIIPQQLNENLYLLGIWKSSATQILRKGQISRIIRNSKYSIIDNRLVKAISNNAITSRRDQRIITNSLAQGSVQDILKNFYFEDMQDHLKFAPKITSENIIENDTNSENTFSEVHNDFSYEFILREQIPNTVEDIEQVWLSEKKATDKGEKTDVDVAGGINLTHDWNEYSPIVKSIFEYSVQFDDLRKQIEGLNLPTPKIDKIVYHLDTLRDSFFKSWDDALNATPICLHTFCEKAYEYTQSYFALLALLVTDEKIRYALPKTGIIPKLQTLFCIMETNKIRMPFYHPVCIFHYLEVKDMYDYIIKHRNEEIPLATEILTALIPKLGVQFPIEFLEWGEKQYALDYTTVWKHGEIIFQNIESGVVYSILDFRMLQKPIIDYIEKHPFLTEITIAILDINNLSGLLRLIDKIQQISQGNHCNIGCITFWILSFKEEEIKKSLTHMWDMIGAYGIVRFRFGKNNYCIKNTNGILQYDVPKIVEEADMTIIADGSVLYHSPRMVRLQHYENMLLNRLEQIDIRQQSLLYFTNGKSDIPILWDTLQHISEEWDDGFWRWRSKSIDNKILTFINQAVANNATKRIVALSSNKYILSEIFKIDYMQAYRQKYYGKNITFIQFDKENQFTRLPINVTNGINEITYSLDNFYNITLELPNISQGILAGIDDILLKFSYTNNVFQCHCSIFAEESEIKTVDYEHLCNNFFQWHMKGFSDESNILSAYLNDLLLNQWHEKAQSISSVLMAEKLRKGEWIVRYYELLNSESQPNDRPESTRDCMEAVKIHDMLKSVEQIEVIDEFTISQFQEKFDAGMLDCILECDNNEHLIDRDTKGKLLKIQERIRDK